MPIVTSVCSIQKEKKEKAKPKETNLYGHWQGMSGKNKTKNKTQKTKIITR